MSVDFQRLAQVRARQSVRRRRWIRGLSTLGIATVIVTISQLVAPVLPGRLLASWLEPIVPLLAREVPSTREVEQAQGRVSIVDRAAGTIRVSSGFLGLRSVELVVTAETLILVGDKEGGFGDIRDGGEVKATWQAHAGTRRVQRLVVAGR
jgi:hypothetical protein